MIPSLLLGAPTNVLTAETSGSFVGYGDGTSGSGGGNAAYGGLTFTPAYILEAGRALHYIHTTATFFEIVCDANVSGLSAATVQIGSDTYTAGEYNSTVAADLTVHRWNRLSALVDGTDYEVTIT